MSADGPPWTVDLRTVHMAMDARPGRADDDDNEEGRVRVGAYE